MKPFSIALIAATLLVPVGASAQSDHLAEAHQCLLMFRVGNAPGARAVAARVSEWSGVTDAEAWRLGATCLQMALRIRVSWSPGDNAFHDVEWSVDGTIENAQRRTYDACVALLARDEVAALTNPVCSPIFLANGLPE